MPRNAPDESVNQLLHTPNRFLRSTQLDRDFADPQALADYCLTGFALQCLESIAQGFAKRSSRRAWRFTGDYGTGKSSFALLLAHCAQSISHGLPKNLQGTIFERAPELKRRRFAPLLVVGAREPMGRAIARKLSELVSEQYARVLPASVRKRVANAAADCELTDTDLVELLEFVNAHLIATGATEGLLLIIDEAGKFLEHAATHPEAQDVMLFQKLAESSTRSGVKPLLVVCLFHVAFGAYAAHLSPTAQSEWEKIAGRFEEISFSHPLDQVAALLATALRVDVKRIPPQLLSDGKAVMSRAREWRWFGSGSSSDAWLELTPQIFPLDPLLLPVAMRVFNRFAQNERSLFNFLFSHESFGLRAFAARRLAEADWLRLPQFFDYVRANLGQRLAQASYRSHWPLVEAVLEASSQLSEIEQETLKTIALLNLLNADDLRPTEDVVVWATAGVDASRQKAVKKCLPMLAKSNRVFFRGAARGYCLWSYSSIDLDKAYEDARQAVPEPSMMTDALRKHLVSRPLVARRHYIESGSLRYFEVKYVSSNDLAKELENSPKDRTGDGTIVVCLCEDEWERRTALKVANKRDCTDELTLVGVTQPLRQLRGYVLDAQRWEWVSQMRELNGDRYAREEVERQLAHARNLLSSQIANFVGLDHSSISNTMLWHRNGKPQPQIRRGRDLLREISEICSSIFGEHSPRLHNELLNRETISSAAAGARIRLIERILSHSDLIQLGIPMGKHPPEMSMYISVLREAKLHREAQGIWRICLPRENDEDPNNFRPAIEYVLNSLQGNADLRISLPAIYAGLVKKPFGVRKGLLPLLITVVYAAHAHEIAFYERGNFVPEVNADLFLRLTKVPELFELQWCAIEGLRAEILDDLRVTLALPAPATRKTRLLEIVTALCMFAVRLPEYARKTRNLTASALAVREILLSAREPVKLLLYALPEACGLAPFPPDIETSFASTQSFVRKLHECLRELQSAYLNLLNRIESQLALHFRVTGTNGETVREQIIGRAARLQRHLREPRLAAFCGRLADTALKGSPWIEAIASLLARKPPAYWVDTDEASFGTELADLCGLFIRVEHLHVGNMKLTDVGRTFRLAVTHADGAEVAEVIHFAKGDSKRLEAIKGRLASILDQEGSLGITAVAQELDRLLRRPLNA